MDQTNIKNNLVVHLNNNSKSFLNISIYFIHIFNYYLLSFTIRFTNEIYHNMIDHMYIFQSFTDNYLFFFIFMSASFILLFCLYFIIVGYFKVNVKLFVFKFQVYFQVYFEIFMAFYEGCSFLMVFYLYNYYSILL